MKKRLIVFLALAVFGLMSLTACSGGGPVLSADIDPDGRYADITASGAVEGDFVMSGTLNVGENDKIVISPDIEGDGSLTVQFISDEAVPEDENAESEELTEAADSAVAALEAVISGTEPSEYSIAPGSYYLRITADGKTGGSARISVEEK